MAKRTTKDDVVNAAIIYAACHHDFMHDVSNANAIQLDKAEKRLLRLTKSYYVGKRCRADARRGKSW